MNKSVKKEIWSLLGKIKDKTASGKDYMRLIELINKDESGRVVAQIELFLQEEKVDSFRHVKPYDHNYWQETFLEVKKAYAAPADRSHRPVRRLSFRHLRKVAAAAVLLLGVGLGTYLLTLDHEKSTRSLSRTTDKKDISPGKDGAILTMQDGSTLVLDNVNNGLIHEQNGVRVWLKDGVITYSASQTTGRPVYNTVTTPRGRQFSVILPDGTQAWLNAASSITYPTTFEGDERAVRTSGEVYLEVAKDARRPFLINIDDTFDIEVLGTKFNINAYADEAAAYTTLLEGSVRIRKEDHTAILKPGQQAQIETNSRKSAGQPVRIAKDIDTDNVMAWKNGIFSFHGMDLPQIMRQMERWYDIEVRYEPDVPDIKLKGEMDRGVSLSGIMRILADHKIQSRLEGRTLIIQGG